MWQAVAGAAAAACNVSKHSNVACGKHSWPLVAREQRRHHSGLLARNICVGLVDSDNSKTARIDFTHAPQHHQTSRGYRGGPGHHQRCYPWTWLACELEQRQAKLEMCACHGVPTLCHAVCQTSSDHTTRPSS